MDSVVAAGPYDGAQKLLFAAFERYAPMKKPQDLAKDIETLL